MVNLNKKQTRACTNKNSSKSVKTDCKNVEVRNSRSKDWRAGPKKPPFSRRKRIYGNTTPTKGQIKSKFDLILPIFIPLLPSLKVNSIKKYISCVICVHNWYIANHGVESGTKLFKELCNYCILLIEGRNPDSLNRVSIGKVDKWPNIIGDLRPIYHRVIDNSFNKKEKANLYRFFLTLFKLNRVMSDNNNFDISNIKETFVVPKSWEDEFVLYVRKRLNKQHLCPGHTVTEQVDWLKSSGFNLKATPFLGQSSGPNGAPKMETAGIEAATLMSSDLWIPFQKLCYLSNNKNFLTFMKNYMCGEIPTSLRKGKTLLVMLRKLTGIPDKGNKSRVIAIVDIWTQTLLAPLEKVMERLLKFYFEDKSAFYSHSKGWDKVLTKSDRCWRSIDATAWTDNLPSRLQYLVIREIFGRELALAWRALAVDCKWNVGNSTQTVKYGKGQGIGTRGSFIIASFTDHLIIEFMLTRHYGKVNDYMKVGDDLVVDDELDIMSNFYPSIGVPVNQSKSKFTTVEGHFIEFVSRNSWDGLDVSIVSPPLMAKAKKQPYLIPTLYAHIKERVPEGSIPDLTELINESCKNSAEADQMIELTKLYQSITGDIISDNNDFQLTSLEDCLLIKATFKQIFMLVIEEYEIMTGTFKYTTDEIQEIATNSMTGFWKSGHQSWWDYYWESNLTLEEIQIQEFCRRTNAHNEERISASHSVPFEISKILSQSVTYPIHVFHGIGEKSMEWRNSPHPINYITSSELPNPELTLLVWEILVELKAINANQKILGSMKASGSYNHALNVIMFKTLNKARNRASEECYEVPNWLEIKLSHKRILELLSLSKIARAIL